jgi:hypothetical protein
LKRIIRRRWRAVPGTALNECQWIERSRDGAKLLVREAVELRHERSPAIQARDFVPVRLHPRNDPLHELRFACPCEVVLPMLAFRMPRRRVGGMGAKAISESLARYSRSRWEGALRRGIDRMASLVGEDGGLDQRVVVFLHERPAKGGVTDSAGPSGHPGGLRGLTA